MPVADGKIHGTRLSFSKQIFDILRGEWLCGRCAPGTTSHYAFEVILLYARQCAPTYANIKLLNDISKSPAAEVTQLNAK